jgi:HTH-type transcriptional regulator / antitoxin HigA
MRKKLITITEKPAKRAKKNLSVIKDEAGYNSVMAQIEQLIKAGNGTIRNKDLSAYSELAKAAADFEHKTYTVAAPGTLEGLLEWKMYELKLKQKGLAKKLHISDAKLSLVMSGKQKPDAALLKSIHTELGIDGNILLSVV